MSDMPVMIHEGITYQQSTHAIYCKSCKTTIQSMDRHDFKECPCRKVFIDGGIALGNRIGGDLTSIEDRSTYFAMIDGKKVWLSQEVVQKRYDDAIQEHKNRAIEAYKNRK